MADLKTIKDLNEKVWYRFLKVAWIGVLVLVIGGLMIGVWVQIYNLEFLKALGLLGVEIGIFLSFQLIRFAFYYVVLGEIFPKEK